MERLVTTSQAAQILGLSLQGIHYRIRKNQLKSIKKSGKTFVYITEEMEKNASLVKQKVELIKTTTSSMDDKEQLQAIIDVKNEQIVLLKDSMKWMKKQYKSEISRLEKNQSKIVKVFKSEIKLLQSAFHEMRSLYKSQPKNKELIKEVIEEKPVKSKEENQNNRFITLQDFFIIMKRYNKTEHDIKVLIFQAIKNNDYRFIYNKQEKKLLILNSDFSDLA